MEPRQPSRPLRPAGGVSLHQEVDFNASPVASARAEHIYQALLDEKQFSAFSGASAQIDREAGGAFKLFGGRVTGRNIELIPNRRIVQAWRVETWPSGVYSVVRFELAATGSGIGNLEEARRYLERALEHQSSPAQKALLRRKRAALER